MMPPPEEFQNAMQIPASNVTLGEEETEAVAAVVRSGWLSSGPRVLAFENAFREYTGARYALAVNTGTAGLHVVLAALGVGPGDEVVCPSFAYIASANAVLYQGATPVLCECDPDTYNATARTLRQRVTGRTRAIISVEMNGLPIDYDEILSVAREFGLPVVIDSAQSFGSMYKGRMVGGISPIHCFSFFPNKTITTGEGGMITADDEELCARMRMIANQGQDSRYHHVLLGYNYRMTELQAALGLEQLKRAETRLRDKERIAHRYTEALTPMNDIRPPSVPDYTTRHSWFMYAVRVPERIRDRVVNELARKGIDARQGFPPIHVQPFYRRRFGYRPDSLPISYKAWTQKIDLPIWPGMNESQQDFVIEALQAAVVRTSTIS